VNTIYLIYYKLYFQLLFGLKQAILIRIILVRGLFYKSFLSHQENVTVVHLQPLRETKKPLGSRNIFM